MNSNGAITKSIIRKGVSIVSDKSGVDMVKKEWSIFTSTKEKIYLDNEILVYNSIQKNKVLKKCTPKIIDFDKGLFSSYLLLEKINADNLKKLTVANKISRYVEALKLIHKATHYKSTFSKINRNPLSSIKTKSIIVLVIALAKNPQLFFHLLKIYHFFISQTVATETRATVFTHKDLSDSNILYSGKRVFLIDFGISELSDKIVDAATIIYNHLDTPGFASGFFQNKYLANYLNVSDKKYIKPYLHLLLLYDFASGEKHTKEQLLKTIKKIQLLKI